MFLKYYKVTFQRKRSRWCELFKNQTPNFKTSSVVLFGVLFEIVSAKLLINTYMYRHKLWTL